MNEWEIYITDEVKDFLNDLDESDHRSYLLVNEAIEYLEKGGPSVGRPLVDRIAGSSIANMKELRPGSCGRSEIRILFAFDPWRSAILLVIGDKSGRWRQWYQEAIPRAERLYDQYLIDRKREESE